jgi:hypothetical protein
MIIDFRENNKLINKINIIINQTVQTDSEAIVEGADSKSVLLKLYVRSSFLYLFSFFIFFIFFIFFLFFFCKSQGNLITL